MRSFPDTDIDPLSRRKAKVSLKKSEKRTRTNMSPVIITNILYLQTVLIKQPGSASQYRMQISSMMFTENFLFLSHEGKYKFRD